MLTLCLALILFAAVIAAPATWAVRQISRRAGIIDSPGVSGQIKAERSTVPNTGGIAIFWAIALPMAMGVLAVRLGLGDQVARLIPELTPHLDGIRAQSGPALALLVGLGVMHAVGLYDDRRPLGPVLKLSIMLATASGVVIATGSGLMTFLDAHAGFPISTIIAVLWLVVVTNAMNFMDNMDGLTGGVAAIASACFLTSTLTLDRPQWFIASCLALLIGACLGFLLFNFPRPPHGRATIYMGDGGSLVIGFLLGFLTIRTTYYGPDLPAGQWYGVFMPLMVLAVPLYDLASVVVIRMSQGRSPMIGDTQHLSHRLERRGMHRRDAVLVIYGLTGITGLGGIVLGSLLPWQAALIGAQCVLALLILALFEGRSTPATDPRLNAPSRYGNNASTGSGA
jgi:UDP-GlcNAc:undecaprenyl-phosphate GlcNAc-1-phosphate transferase